MRGTREEDAAARFRLRFERTGPALWWDHQRYTRELRAAISRAAIASNPRDAHIVSAPPAPQGCLSTHEYADLALRVTTTCADLTEALRGAFHGGLRLIRATRLLTWMPGIRAGLIARCYEVRSPHARPDHAEAFLAAGAWPWHRWKRGTYRTLDVRTAVTDLHCMPGGAGFALRCADTAPRPAEVIAAIFGVPWAEALLLPLRCTGVLFAAPPPTGLDSP